MGAPEPLSAATARNARCPCGSGLRYKACHGRVATPPVAVEPIDAALRTAFDLHRRGRLGEARALYEHTLTRAPRSADAAHMLGVVQLCEGDHERALATLRAVAARYPPAPVEVVENLAMAVAARLAATAPMETEALWLEYVRRGTSSPARAREARVSVVVPSYNHAAFVEDALASALAQSRPALEVVVVDDGSTDATAARVQAFAARHPGCVRVIAREHRGASATINEAVRLARGDWIAVLNSDDRYTPDRLAAMVDAVVGTGASWGFSRCRAVGADGVAIAPGQSLQADVQRRRLDEIGLHDTLGFAILAHNVATSTGTLLFARDLFDRLGGFRDFRYVHDWDFCLRATLEAEPAYVARELYDYRLHGANTILGAPDASEMEVTKLLSSFYAVAAACDDARNPFAPVRAVWGRTFALRVIEANAARFLAPGFVEELADELLMEAAR
jgi:glycosyltransferase involved in cell wall biosynthesis